MSLKAWANFFRTEKLNRECNNPLLLLQLAEHLTTKGVTPKHKPYDARITTRRALVNAAMDLGIDLTEFKIGRGTLDMWNEVYIERFGSNIGTQAWKETARRNIKLKKGYIQDSI